MMPQDFPSSGYEPAAMLMATQMLEARTTRALDQVVREIHDLRALWEDTVSLQRDMVPELALLTSRVDQLALGLMETARVADRPPLTSARHQRRHP